MQSTLNEIANYIEEHGWIQHKNYNFKGECCLNGAYTRVMASKLGYLTTKLLSEDKVRYEIIRKIQLTHPEINGLVTFNDMRTTTKEDVLTMLRSEG